MDSLADLLVLWPAWLKALLWGTVAGLGLPVGAGVAMTHRLRHRGIARVMALGAGALLALVGVHLTAEARHHAGLVAATAAMLAGAALYSLVNLLLAQHGAKNRKRCGGCVAQSTEEEAPGSGLAIAAGTILDAVPEGLALGAAVSQGAAPTLAVVAGFFLSNVPEALSATAGMAAAGRSPRYLVVLWAGATMVTPVAAVAGALGLQAASPAAGGVLDAVSAGLLLAMAAETMLPEAFEGSPEFSGAVAALGFVLLAALAASG